jgi:uncharacterized membrane protein YdjX (TVP38/TMEM64 family)
VRLSDEYQHIFGTKSQEKTSPLARKIIFFTIRPLTFLPATVLTVAGGLLFGPLQGLIFVLIGENLSANLSYLVGKYFAGEIIRKMIEHNQHMHWLDCRLYENGFMAVLVMRLIYLPFDLVGYFSGMCNIRQWDFALGTAVGILPGAVSFVLLGSSFTNPRHLIFSVSVFILSLVLVRILKK